MAGTLHVVIAGSETATGATLAELYRNSGAQVSMLPLDGDAELATAELADRPIDILIFADDFQAPPRRAAELRRSDFEAGWSPRGWSRAGRRRSRAGCRARW
jgi:hypothetical protein